MSNANPLSNCYRSVFLGLGLVASVPDARAMWPFRGELNEQSLADKLSGASTKPARATSSGALWHRGRTFVTRSGRLMQEHAQKGAGARWAKKNGQSAYTGTNHIHVNRKTIFLRQSDTARVVQYFPIQK
ncbi:MAG: hypothetical protein FD134_64 [Gallionellaceae bacterium]|nr:MAG: hypothetical protein FD134_64 [Gallionellaceae bacterium]